MESFSLSGPLPHGQGSFYLHGFGRDDTVNLAQFVYRTDREIPKIAESLNDFVAQIDCCQPGRAVSYDDSQQFCRAEGFLSILDEPLSGALGFWPGPEGRPALVVMAIITQATVKTIGLVTADGEFG